MGPITSSLHGGPHCCWTPRSTTHTFSIDGKSPKLTNMYCASHVHTYILCFLRMQQLFAVATAKDNSSGGENSISLRNEQQQIPKTLDFSGEKPPTPILDTINYPIHMKNLSTKVTSLINNLRPLLPSDFQQRSFGPNFDWCPLC